MPGTAECLSRPQQEAGGPTGPFRDAAGGPAGRRFAGRLSEAVNRAVIFVCAALLALMLVLSAGGIALDLAARAGRALGLGDLAGGDVASWLHTHTRPSVVRFFLPWLGMLSITVAFRHCEHVSIDIFAGSLPRGALNLVKAVNFVAIAGFGLLLAWYGAALALASTRTFIVAEGLELSQRWTASAVPVAGLVLCLHLLDGLSLLDSRHAGRSGDGAARSPHGVGLEAAP